MTHAISLTIRSLSRTVVVVYGATLETAYLLKVSSKLLLCNPFQSKTNFMFPVKTLLTEAVLTFNTKANVAREHVVFLMGRTELKI